MANDKKKKLHLTVRGVQRGFGQEETSEIVTFADYFTKNGKHYIFLFRDHGGRTDVQEPSDNLAGCGGIEKEWWRRFAAAVSGRTFGSLCVSVAGGTDGDGI